MNASSGSGLWPIRTSRSIRDSCEKVAIRDRILDSALDVFARKGYHRAIVDDIVRCSRRCGGRWVSYS